MAKTTAAKESAEQVEKHGDLAIFGRNPSFSISVGVGNRGCVHVDDPHNLLILEIGNLNQMDLIIKLDPNYLFAVTNRICKVPLWCGPSSPKIKIRIGHGNRLYDCSAENGFTIGNGTSLIRACIQINRVFKSYSVYDQDLDKPFKTIVRVGKTQELDDLQWWEWNDRKLEQMSAYLNADADDCDGLLRAATPEPKVQYH